MTKMSNIFVDQAAIEAHGVVFHGPRPIRHGQLIHAMAKLGVPTPINGCTGGGFLLSDGRFATREAAKHVAFKAGQISDERCRSNRVFCTEDLW